MKAEAEIGGQLSPVARAIRVVSGTVSVIHPFPVLVVVITSACVLVIAHGGVPPTGLALRVLAVVLCTQIPVGALNDIVDREQDARVQPNKPIPSGLLSTKGALTVVVTGLVALAGLTASFGPGALLLVGVATFGGIAYDLWLKPTPFAVVAYMVGFLTLFTWLWTVEGRLNIWFIGLYPCGSILLLAAHLAQSLPDIETDRQLGHHGLAVLLGPRNTRRLILFVYAGSAATALVLAIASAQPISIFLAAAGVGIGSAAWAIGRRADSDSRRRKIFFWIIAAGIGLTALACLLAITRLQA
jgi:4-hydroxybenzoate polyprenyltransferase